VGADCAAVPVLPRTPVDPEALRECADEIVTRLSAAQRAAIIVDVEIRRYGVDEQVAELARKLKLPVVTTFMGRGLLKHAHDVTVGAYFGAAGDPVITRLVEDADALLLLGVIVSDTNFALSQRVLDQRHAMLVIDCEVCIGHHSYRNMPIDALIGALIDRANGHAPRLPVPRVTVAYPRHLPADDKPIMPSDIAPAINDLFDRHGAMPMTAAASSPRWRSRTRRWRRPATTPEWASAHRRASASRRRPLILVGDGAFEMTGWELGNCARYGLDPIVVLFNNKSWEMLRAFQPESRFNDLDDWHFADIAKSIGGHGERVATHAALVTALEAAVNRRGQFSLIEVMLPRGVTSDTLALCRRIQSRAGEKVTAEPEAKIRRSLPIQEVTDAAATRIRICPTPHYSDRAHVAARMPRITPA
jgi:indolepyruvate decarboxylase